MNYEERKAEIEKSIRKLVHANPEGDIIEALAVMQLEAMADEYRNGAMCGYNHIDDIQTDLRNDGLIP